MRRTTPAAIVIALAVAACTPSPPVRDSGTSTDPSALNLDVLLLQGEAGPVAVQAPTGSVLADAPGAVTSPDGSLWYLASHHVGGTRVATLDATTGAVLHEIRLDGDLVVRVVSGTGHAVALMSPRGDGVIPIPRSRTPIVVADPTGGGGPRRYVLPGNFEPEAFSVDDSRLFLIQHLPAETPAVYRVTVMDLATGDVTPVRGRFDSPPEQMAGTRLGQVWGPEARQLYTLYSSEQPSYSQRVTDGVEHPAVSFIHVLDAREGWAFCVTLPDAMRHHSSRGLVMAPSADGRRLYLVDTTTSDIAVVDLAALEVTRYGTVLHVPPGSPQGRPSALVSSNGRTLFVGGINGRGLVAIDTSTLRLTGRLITDDAVWGLGSSVDGERLYAALLDRVAVLNPTTGAQVGIVPFSGADSIVGVLTAA